MKQDKNVLDLYQMKTGPVLDRIKLVFQRLKLIGFPKELNRMCSRQEEITQDLE